MSLCIARVYKYEQIHIISNLIKIMGIWQGNSSQLFGLKHLLFCSIESIFEEDTISYQHKCFTQLLQQNTHAEAEIMLIWNRPSILHMTNLRDSYGTLVKQTFKWVET